MKYIYSLLGLVLLFSSCSDFEDVNINPDAVGPGDGNPEYALHSSIVKAHQSPHYAERTFILTWKNVARQQYTTTGAAVGNINDSYMVDYWSALASWINYAQTAINLVDYRKQNGLVATTEQEQFLNNVEQCSRIWKVYLWSEMIDMYGSIPNPEEAMQVVVPNYIGVQEAYAFFQTELKDASSKLITSYTPTTDQAKYDMAYGYDASKWQAYANSLRMRFAMRTADVDPANAEANFRDAINSNGGYISSFEDSFKILEKGDGWDDLTAVMSRYWNDQILSSTFNNLVVGLGGVESKKLLADSLATYIKDADYIGMRYEKHWPTSTDNPMAGFFFDGLPNKIDPRAYRLFAIPGDFGNPEFFSHTQRASLVKTTETLLDPADPTQKLEEVNAKFTWNGSSVGEYSTMGSLNNVYKGPGCMPRIERRFREGKGESRIFFASWESYFLIAEANLRGWAGMPMSAKAAYEKGIEENFSYLGADLSTLPEYLASTEYNNVGTSVSWDHTAEPPATRTMKMKDGYTKAEGTYEYKYPVASNTRYGKALNDQMSKLFTQKYIANMPWLPLEAWNDHRRMGLPFFDTPVVEAPITYMPALTKANFAKQQKDFYPQRSKFPSSFEANNPTGYQQAVGSLGGDDNVFTPLWWAKQN